jgi:hypothetical protein
MESKVMNKVSLTLIVVAITLLAVAAAVGVFFYSGGVNSDSSPSPTPSVTPIPTVAPSITASPTPTSNPSATPNSGHTVTYTELSRNQTMIVIQFKFEPNSYIFQLNATSVYLTEDGTRISANSNDAVIIGTQYSTLFFPISNYSGLNYHPSSDALPSDTVWIKQ